MTDGRKLKKYEKTNPPPSQKAEEEDLLVKAESLSLHINQLLKEVEKEINKNKPKGWEENGTCHC